jgi:hypothetical protein
MACNQCHSESDPSFATAFILSTRMPSVRSNWQDFPNTHPSHSLTKGPSVDGIAIMQQVAGSTVPREGLGNLLCRPFRSGIGGYVEMQQPAPLMGQNEEDKQDSKIDSGDNEEIRGDQAMHMIIEEGTPRLRGRFALANHVLGHRRLRHLDAELEELPRGDSPYSSSE